QQRAVQEFRQLAREQNPNLQMIVPLTEVVGLLQEGVGHLMREAGLALMNCVMDAVKKKLQNAYAMSEYADAKRALDRLHRELMELNPSAARSLEEGMDE